MKRRIVILALAALALGVVAAHAVADVMFVFDPDDLIQLHPASAGSDADGQRKVDQENARRVHNPWGTVYETFYNPANAKTQPDSYNTYMNWRDSLGANEGISAFNIWLLDNPNARSWGEKMVWNPDGDAPTATADAAGNWSVDVIANPWGAGWLVQWYTDDPADYINTTSQIGTFSFSGTAYWDNDEDGYDADDPEVQVGDVARIWFGGVNWTEADGEGGWTKEWSLYFDGEGWGDRSPNAGGPWPAGAGLLSSEGYGSGYEGVLQVAAVPEPFSMAFLASAFVGVVAVRLRGRRKEANRK